MYLYEKLFLIAKMTSSRVNRKFYDETMELPREISYQLMSDGTPYWLF